MTTGASSIAASAIQSYDDNLDASDELKRNISGVIVYNYSIVMDRVSAFAEQYKQRDAQLARDESTRREIKQAQDEFEQERRSIILGDASSAYEPNAKSREK